ncbi:ATPase AAA-2 domain protein [Methylobacterium nodulans ORS 2060]|uniref:ATPase AAA-2 domain protein n=1 Tax=Methylobacterium nodulans (strain LMG 21967 / CNCM I-2342 / ORS 2060) TaxID=460265 RepID=B8IF98_METNO|nr:AAA family ATPase [Methylobacterium nodulans]ACL55809.1 ATPase AAA-2 domain protein [Methylobacterium nodulans ORS 2060]
MICQHGAEFIAGLRIDSYNLALREETGFVSDRVRSQAFPMILDKLRKTRRLAGEDPLGGVASGDHAALDRLADLDGAASSLLRDAIRHFAGAIADVVRRFLSVEAWRGTERIVVGGGLRESRIGEEAIRTADELLKAAGLDADLRPIRNQAIRLDSEYMERHAVARLIGAPPGYVGYEEGGQLTERVRRRPYAVVLLDEIEKAHPDVYNTLLQVFDDGRLTDSKGRVVDFTNTVIIATSNLGADIIQRNLRLRGTEADDSAKLKRELMEVLRGHFRPEFINRIDEIIVFHALGRAEIRAIVALQLERVRRTAQGQGVELATDPSLVDHLAAAGFRPEFGARELRRLIRSELETQQPAAGKRSRHQRSGTEAARSPTASGERLAAAE